MVHQDRGKRIEVDGLQQHRSSRHQAVSWSCGRGRRNLLDPEQDAFALKERDDQAQGEARVNQG